MSRGILKSLALSLSLGIVLLSGVVYAQAVKHTAHHVHHRAATHASVLCSWVCSAGQVLDSETVVFDASFRFLALIDSAPIVEPLSLTTHQPTSRGPPTLSV